jgi:hypothetical protein
VLYEGQGCKPDTIHKLVFDVCAASSSTSSSGPFLDRDQSARVAQALRSFVGRKMVVPRCISTSLDPGVALRFVDPSLPVLVVYRTRGSNVRALCVGPVIGNNVEQEVLLQGGLQLCGMEYLPTLLFCLGCPMVVHVMIVEIL